MSPLAFKAALESLSDALTSSHSRLSAVHVLRLAAIFEGSSEKTAAGVIKKIKNLRLAGNPAKEIGDLALRLMYVSVFAKKISGKKFAQQLDQLIELMKLNSNADVGSFVDAALAILNAPKKVSVPPREYVVDAYVKQLRPVIGSEPFVFRVKKLEQDQLISPNELIAIAKLITNKKPATSAKAIQALLAYHKTMMATLNKSESRRGRSAA